MQVPFLKGVLLTCMHTDTHTHKHTHTDITSFLLASAAHWVTANAFRAFWTYFLCKDEDDISLLFKSLFFRQKGECGWTTSQRWRNAPSDICFFPQLFTRTMLFTFVTQQNPQEELSLFCVGCSPWAQRAHPVLPQTIFFKALHADDDFCQKGQTLFTG